MIIKPFSIRKIEFVNFVNFFFFRSNMINIAEIVVVMKVIVASIDKNFILIELNTARTLEDIFKTQYHTLIDNGLAKSPFISCNVVFLNDIEYRSVLVVSTEFVKELIIKTTDTRWICNLETVTNWLDFFCIHIDPLAFSG